VTYVKDGRYSCINVRDFAIDEFLDSVFSLAALESKLVSYVNDSEGAERPFDVSSIPKVSRQQAAQEVARKSSWKFHSITCRF